MSKVSYERLLASSPIHSFEYIDIHQTGNHDVDLLHKCLEFRTTLACWEAECNLECFVHYRCIFFCQLSRYDMFRIFKATNLLIGIISTTISYFLKRFIIVLKSSLQGY